MTDLKKSVAVALMLAGLGGGLGIAGNNAQINPKTIRRIKGAKSTGRKKNPRNSHDKMMMQKAELKRLRKRDKNINNNQGVSNA